MGETKPTPLTVEYWHTIGRLAIWEGGMPIATIVPGVGDKAQQRAVAERFVRAVNAHDDLLAACKDLHDGLCPGKPVDGSPTAWISDAIARMARARGAIAKATVTP